MTKGDQPDAPQSTGPRSEVGKRIYTNNAPKTGLYARELLVNPEDQHEFETLRQELRRQFTPATSMQEISFEQIVCFCWRCKLALRLEGRSMGPALGADTGTGDAGEPRHEVRLSQWAGASRENLRNGIRFLGNLRGEAAQNGLMHLEQDGHWKDSVINGFGQPFYNSLMQWKGFNTCAVLAQEHLDEHARMFPSRPSDPPQPSVWIRVPPDARLKWEMVVKLIDLQTQHLRELLATHGSRQITNTVSDVCPQYFATASRDLRQAVDWYLYLRDMKL
jgi:hypothetical protein